MRRWAWLLVFWLACPRPAPRARAEAPPSVPAACVAHYEPGAPLSSMMRGEAPFTLPGLVLLAAREGWWELSLRLRELPRKQQNACWRALVGESSFRVVQLISSQAEPGDHALSVASTLRARYPLLAKDARFHSLYREVSLPSVERCFRGSANIDACNASLLSLVEAAPEDREFAMTAAKLAFHYQFHYGSLPFFVAAVRDRTDSPFCADDSLQVATLAGLGLPFDYTNAGIARAIAFRWCPRAMRPIVEEAQAKPDAGTYLQQNVGNFLRSSP